MDILPFTLRDLAFFAAGAASLVAVCAVAVGVLCALLNKATRW